MIVWWPTPPAVPNPSPSSIARRGSVVSSSGRPVRRFTPQPTVFLCLVNSKRYLKHTTIESSDKLFSKTEAFETYGFPSNMKNERAA